MPSPLRIAAYVDLRYTTRKPTGVDNHIARMVHGLAATPEFAVSVCRMVILGAGRFGREVLPWARVAWPIRGASIAGLLSADARILDGHATSLPIFDTPDTFTPDDGDALLLATGIPGARRQVAESLASRGTMFLTLFHVSAIVAATALIGAESRVAVTMCFWACIGWADHQRGLLHQW